MKRLQGDDGVYAILYALLVVVVFALGSIVVDLGQLRADQRDSRSAADTAALAGAADLGIGPFTPLSACKTAWSNTLENLRLPAATDPCADSDADGPFVDPTNACPSAPNSATRTLTASGITIKITWPVPQTSGLLTEPDGKPGSSPRTFDADFDGSVPGCDRIAVAVQRERAFGLAASVGATSGTSAAQSVARATFKPGDGDAIYPLVILDPISCYGLQVTGGTKVLVKNKDDIPGRIGIDSNGTATSSAGNSDSCGPGSAVVIDADGTNALIEAQPGNTGATAAIEIYGPTSMPAKAFQGSDVVCTSTPCIKPTPTISSQRITRRPFDAVYNDTCGATCPGGTTEKAYIERFRSQAVGLTAASAASGGWNVITGGAACGAPPPAPVVPSDPRYFVDCNPYKVGGVYAYPPGSTVIINGDLVVENAGCLVVNATATECTTATTGFLATNALLSVRGDVSSNGSGPRMLLPQTFLHQPLTASRFNGSFGEISWSAPYYADPDEAPTRCPSGQSVASIPPADCFRNLAFWTEAASTNMSPAVITGGGALRLEGTFFLGNAKLRLSGGSGIDVEDSQFVAKRIEASGGSLLTFIPNADRTTPIPRRGVSLVR